MSKYNPTYRSMAVLMSMSKYNQTIPYTTHQCAHPLNLSAEMHILASSVYLSHHKWTLTCTHNICSFLACKCPYQCACALMPPHKCLHVYTTQQTCLWVCRHKCLRCVHTLVGSYACIYARVRGCDVQGCDHLEVARMRKHDTFTGI